MRPFFFFTLYQSTGMIHPVELVYPKICLWIKEGGPQRRKGATSLRRWSPNLAGEMNWFYRLSQTSFTGIGITRPLTIDGVQSSYGLTCPLNFIQNIIKSGPKEGPDYEAQQVCGRANYRDFGGERGWSFGCRAVS